MEWPRLAPCVSEGVTSSQIRMSPAPRPSLGCCGAQEPSSCLEECLPGFILTRAIRFPLAGLSLSGSAMEYESGHPWVPRINHLSFKLIVYPQSIELGQKLWNLFSKMIFHLGKNVPAGKEEEGS